MEWGCIIKEAMVVPGTIIFSKPFFSPYLTFKEKENLCAGVMQGIQATVLAQQIMEVPSLRRCILTEILQNIDQQCTKLCEKRYTICSAFVKKRSEQIDVVHMDAGS